MLSIERCRELLGEDGKDMPDAEVEALCKELYALANVLFDHWAYVRGYSFAELPQGSSPDLTSDKRPIQLDPQKGPLKEKPNLHHSKK